MIVHLKEITAPVIAEKLLFRLNGEVTIVCISGFKLTVSPSDIERIDNFLDNKDDCDRVEA